jgi:hypothetical protein
MNWASSKPVAADDQPRDECASATFEASPARENMLSPKNAPCSETP